MAGRCDPGRRVIGWRYERWPRAPAIRNSPSVGRVAATGLIVAESLIRRRIRRIVAIGSDAPPRVAEFETYAMWIGRESRRHQHGLSRTSGRA